MVIILMATYNGSRFIEKQIQSIINQSYKNWKLYIRDDGSTDNTVSIIKEFVRKDKRISILEDDLGNLRSAMNFGALMQFTSDLGEYFMFCDQDDIWLSTKVEKTLERMRDVEQGKDTLIFCSQLLIDENDEEIPHLIRKVEKVNLSILLATNFVYGCTVMINRALMKKCLPISKNSENHDYWVVLIASIASSNISYIADPLMMYRQHNNNVSGNYTNSSTKNRWNRFKHNAEISAIRSKKKMFEDVVLLHQNLLSKEQRNLILQYIDIVPRGGLKAFFFVVKHGIRKVSRLATFNYYLSILRG